MGSGAMLWKDAGRVPRFKLEPSSTTLWKRSPMTNEHEYFSASSSENRVFRRPGASDAAVARNPPGHGARPALPLQRRGRAVAAGLEEPSGASAFLSPQPPLSFLEAGRWRATPGAGHGGAGLPAAAPVPAPAGPNRASPQHYRVPPP